MNSYKNIKKLVWALLPVLFLAGPVFAATNHVTYDGTGGTLSVAGACSQRFVLVIIRNSSDNSIWGSSNPDCVNGSYSYSVEVPSSDRTGAAFNVQVFDKTSTDGQIPTMNATGGTDQPIIFSAPVAAPTEVSPIITLDTSSIVTVPDDQSFLDATISNLFGLVIDVTDAVQTFTTVIAHTIQASLVATVNLFSKNITVLPGGSITVPAGANEMAGTNWLNAGATDVFIPDTSVTSSSKIIITPTSVTDITLAVTQKNDGVGFHVTSARGPAMPVSFDWLVIDTYTAGPGAQAEQSVVSTPSAPAPTDSDVAPADTTATSTDDTITDTASDTTTDTGTPSDASTSTPTPTPAPPPEVDASTTTDDVSAPTVPTTTPATNTTTTDVTTP